MRLVTLNMFKPSSIVTDRSKVVLLLSVLFCNLFFMFVFVNKMSCLFFEALWSSGIMTLICVVFSCVFVTFPYGVPGQVWHLIVSIPDFCLPLYF